MKKKIKKGFTLAELLIVVAIIAVLVGIAIPVFSVQLEKARLALDKANMRACYADAASEYISKEWDGKTPKNFTEGNITCSAFFETGEADITVELLNGNKSTGMKARDAAGVGTGATRFKAGQFYNIDE